MCHRNVRNDRLSYSFLLALIYLGKNAAHRGAPDLQAASDLRFANASTVELPYLVGVECCRYRPTQALAVLAGVRQAGANSFPENLPFEFCKNGQQARHGSTGWGGQIQRLHERHESDSQMLQFLQGPEQVGYRSAPTIQPPY